MKHSVFFGEKGLTSANQVANMAKEYIQTIEEELNNIQFYSSEVCLIGSSDKTVLDRGTAIQGFSGTSLHKRSRLLHGCVKPSKHVRTLSTTLSHLISMLEIECLNVQNLLAKRSL